MAADMGNKCCGNCTNPCGPEALRAADLRARQLTQAIHEREIELRIEKAILKIKNQRFF